MTTARGGRTPPPPSGAGQEQLAPAPPHAASAFMRPMVAVLSSSEVMPPTSWPRCVSLAVKNVSGAPPPAAATHAAANARRGGMSPAVR